MAGWCWTLLYSFCPAKPQLADYVHGIVRCVRGVGRLCSVGTQTIWCMHCLRMRGQKVLGNNAALHLCVTCFGMTYLPQLRARELYVFFFFPFIASFVRQDIILTGLNGQPPFIRGTVAAQKISIKKALAVRKLRKLSSQSAPKKTKIFQEAEREPKPRPVLYRQPAKGGEGERERQRERAVGIS